MSTGVDEFLILGIGSPFGADRTGWEAVDLLRGDPELAGMRMEVADRPGAGLLGLLRGAHAVILIDALACDSPHGTLHRIEPAALALDRGTSNHGFGVADALALGRVLGMLPPRLALIGISAAGDSPASIERAALRRMVCAIAQEMRACAD